MATAANAMAEPTAQLPLPDTLTVDTYDEWRLQLLQTEKARGFDHECSVAAIDDEKTVDRILQALRRQDNERIYQNAAHTKGHAGQRRARFAGDHFLSNVDLIQQTELFRVAHKMPKGAHLHIHFNACLRPSALLNIAKTMDRMFITSDLPLVPDEEFINYQRCEVQFSILAKNKEKPGNIFSSTYQPRQAMRFSDFLTLFPAHFPHQSADEWLSGKLEFTAEEAHDVHQTAEGAWVKFNGRTRMLKGLFNYETAYREYTRLCLRDFMEDGIQYAEVRPNFMRSNQLFRDDGEEMIDNHGIMEIIIEEVSRFQQEVRSKGQYFGGLKVIYCTPRSMPQDKVAEALDECIEFKKKWPQWIAGFDLVGEEGKGRPLKDFVPQFLDFQEKCSREDARLKALDTSAVPFEIPLLLHCGETLDCGTATDENLVDALLLGAKRIGHAFALPRHPLILEKMRERGVCVELCPISNEVLGLTPRVGGHAMYTLLANNVHCTVNSDNGTIFKSTLSHDFYQVLVGKKDMGIYGWKQLVLWSLEHACMSGVEREKVTRNWEVQWAAFLKWVIREYSSLISGD